MNVLLENLAAYCAANVVREKVLVAPSLSAGNQIAEALALAGTGWLNLRVQSVRTLAAAAAAPVLAETSLRPASHAQAMVMMELACAEVLSEESYFGALRLRPGFHRRMAVAIEEMRLAGLTPGTLPDGALEDERKQAELCAAWTAFDRLMGENGFVTRSQVLGLALERLRFQSPPDRGAHYLVPERMQLSEPELELLRLLSHGHMETLREDDPEQWAAAGNAMRLLRCVGEENEVRGVFGSLLERGAPWDSAEIIYTDGPTYLPIIHDLAEQYGVKCTYEEGVAVTNTRPGQAVLGFLDWTADGLDSVHLVSLARGGALDLGRYSDADPKPGAAKAAHVLASAGIGRGRDRYMPSLDALEREIRERKTRRGGEGSEDNEAEARAQVDLRALAAVRGLVERMLLILPADMGLREVSFGAFAGSARRFVEECTAAQSEADGIARKALTQLFLEIEELPSVSLPLAECAERLRNLVLNARYGKSMPRSGCLHVAGYDEGGYSARPNTFVVGLDDSRHPAQGMQDAVLLDRERESLNTALGGDFLPLRAETEKESAGTLKAALARLRGSVCLSYACRSLPEDREQFPAAVLLEGHRALPGRAEDGYEELLQGLGAPAGFGGDAAHTLDDSQWWLARAAQDGLPGSAVCDAAGLIYPALFDGLRAEGERESERFTEFDGYAGGEDTLADRVLSATALEHAGACPFRFFLKYVLRIITPDPPPDPDSWLDAGQYGSLMHEVFRDFMQTLRDRGEKPSFEIHERLIRETSERLIGQWRKKVPPVTEAAFQTRRAGVLASCSSFLRLEEQRCADIEPFGFEMEFGGGEGAGAVEIAAGEASVKLRGRMDRVDRRSDGTFEIWDYKTGRGRDYSEHDALRQGRQLQHALYAVALPRVLGAGAEVSLSGYLFPDTRGQGLRIEFPPDADRLKDVLEPLVAMLRSGCFPQTDNKDDCQYCDYAAICGDAAAVAERSKRKLDCELNGELEPFGRLRR